MRTMTSVAAMAALLFAAAPAAAQTWYKPAPAYGTATGTMTFNTGLFPVTCTVSSPWILSSGYVRLSNITLSGEYACSTITINHAFNIMMAHNTPSPSYNAALTMIWTSPPPSSSSCVSSPSGFFNNATSTITVYGGVACTISGTLTFPGLQLLP